VGVARLQVLAAHRFGGKIHIALDDLDCIVGGFGNRRSIPDGSRHGGSPWLEVVQVAVAHPYYHGITDAVVRGA
jgi:hypothetical protein